MFKNTTPLRQRTDIAMLVGFGDVASVGTHKRDVAIDCHCLINAVIHGRIATFGIAVLANFGRQLPVVKVSNANISFNSMCNRTQTEITS